MKGTYVGGEKAGQRAWGISVSAAGWTRKGLCGREIPGYDH